MQTPWGESDTLTEIAEGVREVTTPSHGGIMVHESVSQFLTDAERDIGESYGPWIAFEEDCAYSVVFAAMPALWRSALRSGAVIAGDMPGVDSSDDDIERHFLKTAHHWFPDAYGVACQSCDVEPHGLCRNHGGQEALWERGLFIRCSAIFEGDGVRVTFRGADFDDTRSTLMSRDAYHKWPLLVIVTEADYA